MDNNTLLQTIRTQGEQAQLMVEQNKALEQMIEEMTNLKNEMNIAASKTNIRLSEVEIRVEEVNKKVHIDDAEASEIKSIIEFTGEKTHYFNGGMIACRCTVRM